MLRVNELRKNKGLTQKQLADHLEIDQTAISNWERGKGLPDLANLLKLANYFETSLDYLMGRDQAEKYSNADLISYAAQNGLSGEDLIVFIQFIDKIKTKER
jgi:transcriptional regulator with XRE-family HTH domain